MCLVNFIWRGAGVVIKLFPHFVHEKECLRGPSFFKTEIPYTCMLKALGVNVRQDCLFSMELVVSVRTLTGMLIVLSA